jgi:3',5'-cyclic AMP phosphodiesterase CpdA
MKLLVVSDLHSFQMPTKVMPSLVNFGDADRNGKSDPLLGLREMLSSGKVARPDILLCAGDIADKADPLALERAWTELSSIQKDFQIPHFVATCGNHDLDTRHKENKFDPRGFLRRLTPSFPLPEYQKNDVEHLKYWSNNFSIVEGDNWRVLTINSCAYHGYGDDSQPELTRGRISDITLDEIKEELQALGSDLRLKFNICLVHHHLKEQHSDAYADESRMRGAENLLQLLARAEFGEWFVVHGHVHRGSLYCDGGNSGPIVLSCASFSVSLQGDPTNPGVNQFYLVEFDPPQGGRHRIKGAVHAWNWAASYGWDPAENKPGCLAGRAGFGFRGDLPSFAEKLAEKVNECGRLSWSDAVSQFTELKHFLPLDLENLVGELEADSAIVVSRQGQGIREIVKA